MFGVRYVARAFGKRLQYFQIRNEPHFYRQPNKAADAGLTVNLLRGCGACVFA